MNKIYIPNPQKLVKYYEIMAKGHKNPFIEEASTSVNSHPPNPMKVELASPSQQVV